jgi:hypothetical protein
VTNHGTRELRNLMLVDQYDASLAKLAASDGYRQQNNELVWTIDSLPAGATTRFKVHCRCTRVVARACNRVTVTTRDGAEAQDDACLEVRAAAGGLTITLADLRDPVAAGKGMTYEIRVSNQGPTSQRDVTVVATVPVGMIPDRLGTSGPGQPTIEAQSIRFDPVAELAAGETLMYRVRVRTRQAGRFTLRVEVTSQDQVQPLSAEESTEVVE